MNSGLLYKVALLIRDGDDQVKGRFIHSPLLPTFFSEDLGYILGHLQRSTTCTAPSSSPTTMHLDSSPMASLLQPPQSQCTQQPSHISGGRGAECRQEAGGQLRPEVSGGQKHGGPAGGADARDE